MGKGFNKPLKDIAEGIGMSGSGNTGFGGGTSSTLKDRIKASELDMMDQLNKLTQDDTTGLPVLPNIQKDIETAKKTKRDEILGITKGTDPKAEAYKQLYKSGVTDHGRVTRTLRDTSRDFKKTLEGIDTTFQSNLADVEEGTIAQLDDIKFAIEDVETERGQAQYGSNYRQLGVGIEGKSKAGGQTGLYDVASLGGIKDVKEVEEDMYTYDYLTGKEKTKTT